MKKIDVVKLDLYKIRAAEMFHVAYGQVTPAQRTWAKAFLISFVYGDTKCAHMIFDSDIKRLN